jgi:hypothetical protein
MPVRSHRSAARLLVAPLRRWPWTLGVLALAVVALFVASVALREPVRQHVEQRMNAALDGDTVSLGGLTLRPFAVGLDLREVVVVQDPNPEPPVAQIGRLRAALQWRALLRLALVADLELARPTSPPASSRSTVVSHALSPLVDRLVRLSPGRIASIALVALLLLAALAAGLLGLWSQAMTVAERLPDAARQPRLRLEARGDGPLLIFWSWLWGVWGLVLAVPLMVVVKTMCDHIDELSPVVELLGT